MNADEERDRACACETVLILLDEIGLASFLFEVVLHGDEWGVVVEHPHNGAWRTQTFRAGRQELLRALDDPRRRAALAARWSEQLAQRDAA